MSSVNKYASLGWILSILLYIILLIFFAYVITKQKDVIKKGTLKILDYGNNCLAYERIYQNEIIGVIINLGEEIKISDKEVLLTNKTRKDYLKKYQYLIYKGEE